MYYKITNKECEVYKKLHELRTKELLIKEENEKEINEKTGLEWKSFLGHSGQQNFRRTTQFSGFKFLEPDKVCLRTWKEHSEHKGFFVPNRKTKVGREMSEFLLNGLRGSNYNQVFEILNLEHSNRFTFPYVEIEKDIIVVYLKDEEPKDENLIEITKKEFNDLLGVS